MDTDLYIRIQLAIYKKKEPKLLKNMSEKEVIVPHNMYDYIELRTLLSALVLYFIAT